LFGRAGHREAARLVGHLYHTAAVGQLVTSLYGAGRAEYRSGPDDPSPGVPSIRAVLAQLDRRRLDQVVEVDVEGRWVFAQGRCRLVPLVRFLAERDLTLVGGAHPVRRAIWAGGTVGAGVIGQWVVAEAVDCLVRGGWVERVWAKPGSTDDRRSEPQGGVVDLPGDALVVAAVLATRHRATDD
jgi:hypothetical protein